MALTACSEVKQGVMQPVPPLAGLRYVNLVNDTGAVDFRIVNFIGDAPSAGAAAFRTGGAPYGVSTAYLPYHWPVEANREVNIRVFMNGSSTAVASQVVFDTTCTFAEGVNYTFYLYGNARGAGVHSKLTVDTVAAPTGIAVRALNLGGTTVGTVDLSIAARNATYPLSGTATFAGVAPGAITSYVALSTSASYKALLSAPGARSAFTVATYAPAGVAGTSTSNPVGGTNVAGTALTAVIVPASVTSSGAPQTGNPSSKSTVAVTRAAGVVTVEVGSTTTRKNRIAYRTGGTPYLDTTYAVRTGNAGVDTIIKFRRTTDTSLAAVGNTHGFTVGDMALVSGATETEYNGWHYVTALADTTVCLPPDPIADFRRTCSRLAADTLRLLVGDTLFAAVDTVAGVAYSGTVPVARSYTSRVISRFRYAIGSTTVATPATGTPVYRVYTAANQAAPGNSNYTLPWVLFLVDRKPALTAP